MLATHSMPLACLCARTCSSACERMRSDCVLRTMQLLTAAPRHSRLRARAHPQLNATTFLHNSGEGAEEALLQLSSAGSSSRLKYLGPDCIATVAGLRIAAFDDLRAQSAKALERALDTAEGDIDLLLTPSWPSGVLAGTAPMQGEPVAGCARCMVSNRCILLGIYLDVQERCTPCIPGCTTRPRKSGPTSVRASRAST